MTKAVPPWQSVKKTTKDDINNNSFASSSLPNIKTHDIVYSIVEASPKDLAYNDLIGCFPYKSSRGNKYIFVGFDYNTNIILVESINSRNTANLTAAWK